VNLLFEALFDQLDTHTPSQFNLDHSPNPSSNSAPYGSSMKAATTGITAAGSEPGGMYF